MTRCVVCGNLTPYCTCAQAERPREPTPYEKLVAAARTNLGFNAVVHPTVTDLLVEQLGGDPSQDGLYLCRDGCGFTVDHECAYGGWHTDSDSVMVIGRPPQSVLDELFGPEVPGHEVTGLRSIIGP